MMFYVVPINVEPHAPAWIKLSSAIAKLFGSESYVRG